MATTSPLSGVRYDPARISVGRVLAPPYDVIGEAQREHLYELDPHNIVRIDFARDEPGDVPGERDRYTRAREHLDAWLASGILRRDARPTVYLVDHGFRSPSGQQLTRRGLYLRVRALPWEESDVLPHERTLRGPKEDRLALMRATRAQTSAVLLAWDSAPGLSELLAAAATEGAPDLSVLAEGEVAEESHHLWAVDDPIQVAALVEALRPARLYMADGHHRFETAAAYAAERRAAEPGAAADADFAWTLAHLCAADDPALLVLPTHRLVLPGPGVPAGLDELVGRLPARWRVERAPDLEAALTAAAQRRSGEHAVAVGARDGAALVTAPRDPHASPRARLDVTVVETEILGPCGLDAERITAGALGFVRRVEEAAAAVASGRAALAICLNPCTAQEMIAVSDAGEQMPQKSTYFYPKVPTGLVLSPL